MQWFLLFLSIGFEITGTSLLKLSNGFTRLLPSIGTVVAYILCFGIFSTTLTKIDLGVAYAVWSAVGITAIAVIGIFFFHENVNAMKLISIVLIVLGVIGLNLSGAGH